MDDELIRLDATIIGIDNLINKASTAEEAKVLFTVKDVIYSQQRYFTDVHPVKHGRWIEENSVSEGYLSDWYISSVDNTETPIWTDEHIEELCHDFWIIPKTRMDGDNHD